MNIEDLTDLPPRDMGKLVDPDRPILSMDYRGDGPHRVVGHHHPRAQILYPVSGTYRINTPQGNWIVPRNQAIWIPSHVFHEVYSNTSVDSLLIFIDETYTHALPQDCMVINVSPLLREMFVRAVAMGNRYLADSKQSRFVKVMLDEIIEMQPAPFHLPLATDKRVRRVMDVLLENPADNHSLDQFAEMCGASARTLERLFKKEAGMNFSEWRQQLLIMEAVEQLGQGHSVTSVALDLGYSSASAFISMFKRIVGTPPGEMFR